MTNKHIALQLNAKEAELIAAGIAVGRLSSARLDLQHRVVAAQRGALAWGAFTARKPANSKALVVGAGPMGSFVAMRLSRSGVCNVALKVRGLRALCCAAHAQLCLLPSSWLRCSRKGACMRSLAATLAACGLRLLCSRMSIHMHSRGMLSCSATASDHPASLPPG